MKNAWILAGAVSYVALTCQPVWAKCVPLIQEVREQLAGAHLSKGEEARVNALLEEAEKLSEANNHKEGMKKANDALAIIKKK